MATTAIKLIPISSSENKAPAGMFRPVVYSDKLGGLCIIEEDSPNIRVARALCNLAAKEKSSAVQVYDEHGMQLL